MESKEILAVILAALGIILLIGILSMVTKKNEMTEESSVPAVTEVTQPDPVYFETDIWDVIREQNATTAATEETLEDGTPVTTGSDGETGTLPEGAETLNPDESGILTESGAETETETTTVTEATADLTPKVQTYILNLP
ncbi:MAG: hypothetical protein IJM46_11015 [Oscillospiraceae bacterium]|jgi:hypothetical protein|nr:hypothetical protein [Oscillospiraceae bacterium]